MIAERNQLIVENERLRQSPELRAIVGELRRIEENIAFGSLGKSMLRDLLRRLDESK